MKTFGLSRRAFLRAGGVTMALPMLDVMAPRRLVGAEKVPAPRRMVLMCTMLGLHTEYLNPTQAGRDYEPTPYLDAIKEYRNDFTVVSGLSHPEVDGGHSAEASYLTGAAHPRADSFKNTISLDQYAVEKLNPDTRFKSLSLSSGSSRGLSYTRSGVSIPADDRPSQLFQRMFVDGTPTEVKTQVRRLRQGQSIMDAVLDQANAFQKKLGVRDREKLDEYFAAVREVEQRLVVGQDWAMRPKPKVDTKPPVDVTDRTDLPSRVRLMFDMIHLALKTDSSRFITFAINGMNAVPRIDGVTQDWHNLSHHGQDEEKLAELKLVEIEQFKRVGELLGKLKSTAEGDSNLLERTIILFGSNLGNASSHSNKNMPIVVAGGGFRHGQHLAFDSKKNPPLCNLYVQFLQLLGADVGEFASSENTSLPGLEPA
jgi:hypothetical protein